MGTLYRYESKKILCQKLLWIAVTLMTVILVCAGLTDVISGRAEIGKNYRQFSGREIDDSLIKETQETKDPDHYIVFRNFINFCMGTADYENVNEEEGYAGIFTSVYVANFMLLLLAAIGICGIFADERSNGTDQNSGLYVKHNNRTGVCLLICTIYNSRYDIFCTCNVFITGVK